MTLEFCPTPKTPLRLSPSKPSRHPLSWLLLASLLPTAAQAQELADLVIVSKSARTLTVYAHGQPLRTYSNIQLGQQPIGPKQVQGDSRTPEGRYTLDYGNPHSAYHLSLHISYPAPRDRTQAAALGQSPGGDIFIHGQPNDFAGDRVEGDWTLGCIALANAEMDELWVQVGDGTPIEIAP